MKANLKILIVFFLLCLHPVTASDHTEKGNTTKIINKRHYCAPVALIEERKPEPNKSVTSHGLTVEEYRIGPSLLVSADILENRKRWRTPPTVCDEDMIGHIHTRIKPLGYELVKIHGAMRWQYRKDGKILAASLSQIEGFSMDARGRYFVFLAKKFIDNRHWVHYLIQNDQIEAIQKDDPRYRWFYYYQFIPFYVGNQLVRCEVEDHGYARWSGQVRTRNKILYSFAFTFGAGGMPVSFKKSGGGWLLQIYEHEKPGRVILNGTDLRKKYRCEGMWQYTVLQNRPFFFFTRKGDKKILISYAGEVVPSLWYDYIGNNGAMALEIKNSFMVAFKAARRDHNLYVEAGVYR